LLVGGFSESPYLTEILRYNCAIEKVKVHRPLTSWSAVVQGAVLCGIEKSPNQGLVMVSSFKKSYGIVMHKLASNIDNIGEQRMRGKDGKMYASSQIQWLFHKDNIVLRNTEMKEYVTMQITHDGKLGGSRQQIIYSCEEDIHDRPTTTWTGLDGKFLTR
jgi:hypothetical protein